ncbi:tam [Symbiodinium microadriaticum]|nr:tam [Symbiodinium microadriaticum]
MNDAWQSTSRILSDWWQSKPRRLEASAFLRDILALSELCPNVQIEWQRQFNVPCSALILIWRFIKDFIKRQVLPTLSRCADSKCLTTSPYAGGLDISHARQASEIEAGGRCNFVLPTLKVATFNPGRLGLTSFCNQVLEWRLWDIASTLFDLDVGICFLPGARFPEGAQLPNDFPFVFVGERSPSWDSVGALVRIEAMHAVTVDESRSSSRVLFLNVMHEADNTVSHLCGFYAGPGGDLQTWTVIIEAMQELRSVHSDRVIAAFGIRGSVLLGRLRAKARQVKIARPSPIGDSPSLCPDSFGSYEDFQVAVKSLVSSRNSSRLFHFAELQRQSPAAAQQFVSDFLNKHNGFEIALVDPDSNEPLGVAQTIETLQTDLEDRANNDFPQSEEERNEVQIQISSLRHSGGFFPQNAVSVISGAAKVEFETQDVTIRHILATCSQEPFWAHLVQQDIALLQSGNVDVFMQRIFSFDADLSILGSRVEFVGRTILAVADQLSASHS